MCNYERKRDRRIESIHIGSNSFPAEKYLTLRLDKKDVKTNLSDFHFYPLKTAYWMYRVYFPEKLIIFCSKYLGLELGLCFHIKWSSNTGHDCE